MPAHEDFETAKAMISIKTLLLSNQQTFNTKLVKLKNPTGLQLLQANTRLRSGNDMAFNQLINECSKMNLMTTAMVLEQLRQNVDLSVNSLARVCHQNADTKFNAQSVNPLSLIQLPDEKSKINQKLVESLTETNPNIRIPVLNAISSKSMNHSIQSYMEIFKPPMPVPVPEKSPIYQIDNSSLLAVDKAKKLYKDLLNGKANINEKIKTRDPFVLIELSQLISNELMSNIEKSKIDMSKLSDFHLVDALHNNSAPFDLLESIKNSIIIFYTSIAKLKTPMNDKEFELKHKKLEDEILKNVDLRTKEFWKKVIRTCLYTYDAFKNTNISIGMGVQTEEVDDFGDKILKGGKTSRSEYVAKIIGLEAENKELFMENENLIQLNQGLEKKIIENKETIKNLDCELTIFTTKQSNSLTKEHELEKNNKYIKDRFDDTQKRFEIMSEREKDLIFDLNSIKGVYNEILKFLVALKDKVYDDSTEYSTISPKVSKYIKDLIEFIQKWDYIKFNEVNLMLRKWLVESTNFEEGSTRVWDKQPFELGIKHRGSSIRKLAMSRFLISNPISIFSSANRKENFFQSNANLSKIDSESNIIDSNFKKSFSKKNNNGENIQNSLLGGNSSQNKHLKRPSKILKDRKSIFEITQSRNSIVGSRNSISMAPNQTIPDKRSVNSKPGKEMSYGKYLSVSKTQSNNVPSINSFVNLQSRNNNWNHQIAPTEHLKSHFGKINKVNNQPTSNNMVKTHSLLSPDRQGSNISNLKLESDENFGKIREPSIADDFLNDRVYQNPRITRIQKDGYVALNSLKFDSEVVVKIDHKINCCYSYTYIKSTRFPTRFSSYSSDDPDMSRAAHLGGKLSKHVLRLFREEMAKGGKQSIQDYLGAAMRIINYTIGVIKADCGNEISTATLLDELLRQESENEMNANLDRGSLKEHVHPSIFLSNRVNAERGRNGSVKKMINHHPLEKSKLNPAMMTSLSNKVLMNNSNSENVVKNGKGDLSFIPYTVKTDFFNKYILKSGLRGIRGLSLAGKKDTRPLGITSNQANESLN
jgi:hypothetical protein